jgi:tetratricopeptide (TPR) repeat protein
MNNLRTLLCFFGLVLLVGSGTAQSGKAFFKDAEALRADNQLDQALEKYDLAVQVDPKYLKAYEARADVYELLGRKQESAADRRKVSELDPAEPKYAAAAAKAYVELGDMATAEELCARALKVDPKCMEALQARVRIALAKGDVDVAVSSADAALAVKATTDTYYLHGLARIASRDYKTAEFDFDKVIEWNYLYEPAYVALAETQLKLFEQYSGSTMQTRTLEKAIEKCTRALELNPGSTDALFARSKAFGLQKEYAKAIDDVSKCMALGRVDAAVHQLRAAHYHGFGQHQNAVNDLNKVLSTDPTNVPLLLFRAECREANLDLEGAKKDLESAEKAMALDTTFTAEDRRKISEQRTALAKRIFEENRESDPPSITVVEPYRRQESPVVMVGAELLRVKVTGHVRDRNLLKSIRVNNKDADFTKEDKDPEFFINIPLKAEEKTITVEATDVYDNMARVDLVVERSESIPPELSLITPRATGNRTVNVLAGREDLFLEGLASDPSGIRSISVDGVMASYRTDTTQTDFSIKLDIKGRTQFTIRAEDQYGNGRELSYTISHQAPEPLAVKPSAEKPETPKPVESATGTTWVIHVANADYRNFPALNTSANDMEKMRKAFSKYSVQKTITKRNLSKQQLERFFNIELRDLARTNKVETILVWYSGHGRTVGGKSFWVPVDGKKDDIYSFYNYGALKSQMQNYSETVRNTLVVSDAAGSEASIYDLTR